MKPSYLVASRLSDGQVLRRHKDHFKIYIPQENVNSQSENPKNSILGEEEGQRTLDQLDNLDPAPLAQHARPPAQQIRPDQVEEPPARLPNPAQPVQPQQARGRVQFRDVVEVQEIPPVGHGRALRSKGPAVEHPHVQPTILERSQPQQEAAQERIVAHNHQEDIT